MHSEPFGRLIEAPTIVHIHRHERRDMEALFEFKSLQARTLAAGRQHVLVPLAPRGVGDFRHDRLESLAGLIEAVIKAHRVHAITKIAQMRQQPDRPVGAGSGVLLDQAPHGFVERKFGGPKVVRPAEPGKCRAARGPEGCRIEQRRQLREVDIQHEQPVAKAVTRRRHAPVPNPPFVDAAVHNCAG